MQWMFFAPVYDNQGNEMIEKICPFCRNTVPTSDEGIVERYKKGLEAGDPVAICNQGNLFFDGEYGFPQDHAKALELWHRAGELGFSRAYCGIGSAYDLGDGVGVDKKKALYYWELAAIGGSVMSRYNAGCMEYEAGKMDRALKHFMIAVVGGCYDSLEVIKILYLKGHATKDDYMKALQTYQTYLGEIKSVQRDEAAAFRDHYRYY